MTRERDFFDRYPPPFGDIPPHVGTPTSRAAAESVAWITGKMATQVLAFIGSRASLGATDDEIEVALGFRHQTASARRRELELKGAIVKTNEVRATRSGRKAAVYVVRR